MLAGLGWSSHYSSLEPDKYYIKFDDDIVYIKDGAIDDMLHEKLRNRFWLISANVINHSGRQAPGAVMSQKELLF